MVDLAAGSGWRVCDRTCSFGIGMFEFSADQESDRCRRTARHGTRSQLDRNGLAPTIARFQSVGQPWHAWNASSGRTSLQTLAGDEMDVSMSFWSGTLWTMVRAAPSGDGYCLLVASGSLSPDQPIAWWVKPSGVPKGKIADAAACATTAPN
jgi:hypothetical protein